LLGCAGSRTRASTGEYIDDSAISTKVKTALHADEDVSGFQVNVETFKGVVQLSGFVDTAAQAQKAEQIARRVEGVEEVRNNLTVK
jgi:osmotically-inducible protein OsmY